MHAYIHIHIYNVCNMNVAFIKWSNCKPNIKFI